ncbi:MAG: type II toxin-antitoxin system VapC family toxin [Spartobacteria bacterium]|nr:type II toxin-antitoxin system VapC family toxin [Spartobacteria bacterium]
MNILLDTHAYLWFLAGDDSLSAKARGAIESSDNTKFVSIASLWEITIKYRLGKLELEEDLRDVIAEYVSKNGFNLLPIEIEHLLVLNQLPMHHRDPFDRILISQCIADGMACISVDGAFKEYSLNVVW